MGATTLVATFAVHANPESLEANGGYVANAPTATETPANGSAPEAAQAGKSQADKSQTAAAGRTTTLTPSASNITPTASNPTADATTAATPLAADAQTFTENEDSDTDAAALSFFSWLTLSDPEPATTPQQRPPANQPGKRPLPALPPADNTPKTLPQPYILPQDEVTAPLATQVLDWGPFYWTLSPQDNALGMEREFAAGPFWEQRMSHTRHDSFLRPLWTEYDHFAEGRHDLHILTPAFTRRLTPLSYDWNVFLFINYSRLGAVDEQPLETFMVFPLFFWHDDPVQPDKSFWGLFPIYGKIIHFFSFQRLEWTLFPLYTKIESWYNVTRYGVPYPFIQIFTNEAKTARGFYLWPLYGHAEYDGVYDRMFWMWPLVYRQIDQLHRPIPRVRQGFLPFYAFEYSEHVEDVSILMLWGWRNNSKTQYHETRYLWPLWIQGRSPERMVNRWAPFYTHSKTPRIEKWWYMWPLVQHRKVPERGVLMERSQFFYFLYWHETQTSIDHPELPQAEMRFIWPFYASYDNGAGIRQTQVLSIFEVFFPHNRAMRDTYSPLFALYRAEANANTGLQRWSLLWNLVGSIRTERDAVEQESFHIWPLYESQSKATPETQSDGFSILFGLLGWNSTATTATAIAPDAVTTDPVTTNAVTTGATDTATTVEANDQAAVKAQAEPAANDAAETKNTLTLFWFDIDL